MSEIERLDVDKYNKQFGQLHIFDEVGFRKDLIEKINEIIDLVNGHQDALQEVLVMAPILGYVSHLLSESYPEGFDEGKTLKPD